MVQRTHITWKQAWHVKKFRSLFIFGIIGFFITVLTWPHFLGHIEERNGVVLNDPLLAIIPIMDLSIPIFAFLWSVTLLMFIRMLQNPKLLLMFLYSYWLLFLARMLTIQLISLNPPIGLLKLRDPISNLFYGNGGIFITKDLFFSGHTASLILISLFFQKKWEKNFALLAAFAVGIMVLFQHIHYTIDVLFAPAFAFVIYWIVQKWLGKLFVDENKNTRARKQNAVIS